MALLLGWVAFSLVRVRRRVVLENLDASLALDERQRLDLARRIYRNMAAGVMEFLMVRRLTREHAQQILGEEGLQSLRDILSRSRGMLVLTAHLGSWDLLACAAARCGLPVNVVTRRIKPRWLNHFWMRSRARAGVRLLPAQGSARQVLRCLRQNEIVAMVLDQHQPGGVPTPFFGRLAYTSPVLARLARCMGSPVVPVFLLRDGPGKFALHVGKPVELSPGPGISGIQRATCEYTWLVEEQVRKNPDQWLWLHRRWKINNINKI